MDNVYTRALRSRFNDVRKYLDAVVEEISGSNDNASRAAKAEELFRACRDLLSILDESDRPRWLNGLIQEAVQLKKGDHNHSLAFMKYLIANNAQIQPVSIHSEAIDIDAIYTQMKAEQRLPELFDRIIDALATMIESGEVHDVTVLNALNKLLSLLRANRDGSYIALRRSFDAAVFVRTLIVGFAKKWIPGAEEFTAAYVAAVDATKEPIEKLDSGIQRESIKQIINDKALQQVEARMPARISGPTARSEAGEQIEDVAFEVKNEEPTESREN